MADVVKLIGDASWKPTSYIQPHEYVLIQSNEELFSKVMELMAKSGYLKEFQGRDYRYVDIGGCRYWRVGDVLNREKLKDEG